MTCLQQLWRKPLFSKKKENGSTAEVCKITPEQTKNFWKKSSGQVRRSGDVCPKCISPHWQKQNASYGECYGATAKATYSLAVTQLTMNSSGYQSILKSNVRSSVQQKKFSPNWTMQEDNDPNHRVKTTIQWLGEKIKASTFMTVKCWQEQMTCISSVQLRKDENDVNNKIITA